MTPSLEETITLDFVTSSSTGAAADADSTPTAEVFEDATDAAILAPTVTKRTSKTGNYRVPVACTAANGFEAGKSYNVIASATIGGIAAKAKIGSFQVRARDTDDIMPTYTQPNGFLAATFPSDPADQSLIIAATDAILTAVGTRQATFTAATSISFPANFSVLAITASTGRVDLGSWLGVAPLALSSQQVQAVVPSSTVVASVTGAVGSVTGNVGGNVTGSVGSVIATVNANVTEIHSITLTGVGTSLDPWGPA